MPKTILVVDDDRRVLRLVSEMLTRRGERVRLASTGEEALRSIASDLPDLMLLDLMLPGIDGTTVAQRLREAPATAALPIVFFTGLLEAAVGRRRGSNIAGHYVLGKPFDADELYDVIDRAFAEGGDARKE